MNSNWSNGELTTPPDPLGIQIGAREIYDKLGDVDRKVSGLGGRLDRIADQADGIRLDVVEVRGDITDHETRIRSLERTAVTRDDMAERSRRLLTTVSLLVTVIGIVIGTLTTVIIALVK